MQNIIGLICFISVPAMFVIIVIIRSIITHIKHTEGDTIFEKLIDIFTKCILISLFLVFIFMVLYFYIHLWPL